MTKKIVVAVVLLGVTTCAFAKRTTGSDVAVVKTNESVFKVMYHSAEKSTVQVRIANAEGEIIFKESFKNTDGFVRPYNLSELPKGSYSVTVDNGNAIRTELIEYRNSVAQKNIHFGKVIDQNKIAITGFSSSESEFFIKVLDQQKREVFAGSYTVNGQFGKLFKMKDISSYTIEVYDENGLLKSF
ncbi:MAG: hypothetical protein ACKOE6_00775, partial [Flammeovirgaceae bacterium]